MPRRSPSSEAASTSDPDRLAELSAHRHATVRITVATNPATPDDTLLALTADPDSTVRANAAGEAIARPHLHPALSRAEDPWVRAILAAAYTWSPGQGLARDIQERLVDDEFWEVRGRIGATTSHLDVFERLLTDTDPKVRAACAQNPRLTRVQMDLLLADSRAEVRSAAVALGVIYPDAAQLARAASDRSTIVRWQVIVRPGTPLDVLDLLLDDVDDGNQHDARRARAGDLNSPHIHVQARRQRDAVRGFSFGDEVEIGQPPDDRSVWDA